jgi:small subunit ribosomal protein S16
MVSIKLKLIGKKGQRSFRIIVQEARSKLRGKFIEDLGWYNPHSNQFELKKDRVLHWLGVGARPTATVSQLIKKSQKSAKGGNSQTGPRVESTDIEAASKE